MFRELKQQIGAFSYHFRGKSMPRLNRFLKKTDPLPLESVTSPKDRKRILKTVRATELYALISSIAMGILQILSVEFDTPALRAQLRYRGAPAGERISEANLMGYLRQRIFVFMLWPDNSITQLIRSVQKSAESEKTSKVAQPFPLPTFPDVFPRFPQDFCALLAFVILKNFPLSSYFILCALSLQDTVFCFVINSY